MKCVVVDQGLLSVKSECVIVGCCEGDKKSLKQLDDALGGAISQLGKRKEFTGEFGQTRLVHADNIPAENVLLVGLGKEDALSLELLRRASAHAIRAVRLLGIPKIASVLQDVNIPKTSVRDRAQVVVEGAVLANYQFVKYKTLELEKIKFVDELLLLASADKKEVQEGVDEGVIIAESQCWVRDLVNTPPSEKNAEALAKHARKLPSGVKVSVFDKKKIKELGMGGLLAVNAGSVNEPRFIVAEYKKSSDAPIVFVGKGVTFDSGGLSLKPAKHMEEMKMDMAGAAVVLAVLKSVAELELPVHVMGVIAATDNMPSASSYMPGDIISTYSKKTIEVLNTDAEGRIILSDALAFAEEQKPQAIIDVATLTGACVVALGSVAAGVTGSHKELVRRLHEAGDRVSERLWPLPLYDEFKEMVKSDVADVKNLGVPYGEAGALTAAAFLSVFVEKTPWAHIDIAGPAWSNEEKFYWSKGGTGFGVRVLVEVLKSWKRLGE